MATHHPLTLDLFVSDDAELVRYRLLAGLQRVRRAFDQTRVYPYLADLIRLRRDLVALRDQSATLRSAQPGRIQGIDWKKREVVYVRPDVPGLDALPVGDLVDWTLPRLTQAIEEGQAIYEFVESHTAVEAVGLVPRYQDEGYLLIPEETGWRAVRYAVSVLVAPGEGDARYRSLRTSEVPLPEEATEPGACKRALAEQHRDLPNPATYCVHADVTVPTDATLMPVAKRKLLRYLAERGPCGEA